MLIEGLPNLCEGDVNQCIIEGASFGRDCDTISRVAGSVAGALQGARAICQDWIETCENGCKLSRTLDVDVGQFFKIASPVVASIAKKELTTDLEILKALLEE